MPSYSDFVDDLHGFAWPDAPAQQDVYPGEIAEIAQKLREDAGLG